MASHTVNSPKPSVKPTASDATSLSSSSLFAMWYSPLPLRRGGISKSIDASQPREPPGGMGQRSVYLLKFDQRLGKILAENRGSL